MILQTSNYKLNVSSTAQFQYEFCTSTFVNLIKLINSNFSCIQSYHRSFCSPSDIKLKLIVSVAKILEL